MQGSDVKGHVLVVDDLGEIRELLRERLSLDGYTCRISPGGDDALTALAEESFDVVLSDFRMPGMSGLTLLQHVRQKYPQTAFIMVTVEDDARVAVEAMKQGASDYLLKPSQIRSVAASVERALEKKRLELELEKHRLHLEQMVTERTRQLTEALEGIEQTYDGTLEALGAALDLRDGQTAGHSERVSRYCLRIARTLGLSEEALKQLVRGAYLHDIGKMAIPDSILLKNKELTVEEMRVMQSHVKIGRELVERVAFLAPAAELIFAHQERWDGRGYPRGLRGTEIPLPARIFAVADALDAITSERPYRQAVSFAAARAEIARQSGLQFDPEVVRVFLSIPLTEWEQTRNEVSGKVADEALPRAVPYQLARDPSNLRATVE
jgi:putative nucleotidyltransferase with HDIG domain